MDHLRLQSAFKFVANSRFGDGGQLMTAVNLWLEAVQNGRSLVFPVWSKMADNRNNLL